MHREVPCSLFSAVTDKPHKSLGIKAQHHKTSVIKFSHTFECHTTADNHIRFISHLVATLEGARIYLPPAEVAPHTTQSMNHAAIVAHLAAIDQFMSQNALDVLQHIMSKDISAPVMAAMVTTVATDTTKNT
jgi:hypothetical protein